MAREACCGSRDGGLVFSPSGLSPPGCECAFSPFDVLSRRFAILFDQIPQQWPERLALLMFRQDPGNVIRHRIGSSGTDFPLDSGELFLGQTDGDLRLGHTSIIPFVISFGREAQELGARQEINGAVRTLPDIADTLMAVGEEALLGDDSVAIQYQAHEGLRLEPADE
jgi:hypothetical protein